MLTCQSPLCKMRACLYSHMRRLKKKKSHKKQHLCYRDVFNKYTERAPATKKSCQGQKEPSIGTVYISKFFQEEWKRLPSLMENGGATVRNLLAASSLRLLLQSSPLTRAWSREGRGGGDILASPGIHALGSTQGWSFTITFLLFVKFTVQRGGSSFWGLRESIRSLHFSPMLLKSLKELLSLPTLGCLFYLT